MENNKLELNGHKITAFKESGMLRYKAREVTDALGIDKTAIRRLDDDEKAYKSIKTKGGNQEVRVISEPGFYHLALTSKSEIAVKFRKTITRELLPKMREFFQFSPDNIVEFIEKAGNKRLLQFEKRAINALMEGTRGLLK